MPDATFKISYQYNQQFAKIGGWTENFYSNAANLPSAAAKAEEFRPILNAVHGKQSFMRGYVVKKLGGSRLSKKVTIRADNQAAPSTFDSDFPTTALLLILSDPDGNVTTRQWIKGIPDENVERGYYNGTPGGHQGKLDALIAYLKVPTNTFCMRAANPVNLFKNITDVSTAGVIKVAGHGWLDKQIVRVGKVKGPTSVNGLWEIFGANTDTFKLVHWIKPGAEQAYVDSGHARRIEMLALVIKEAVIDRVTKRDIGRPTEMLSGRRKKPKILLVSTPAGA